MKERNVDVAVIGAGTAGLGARRAAAGQGASVVMIEDGPYGTTCARVGCMPSKLLIASADLAHEINHADLFGLRVQGTQVDSAAVLDRVRRERDRFVGFVLQDVEELPAEVKIRGRARFVEPTVLQVDDHTRVVAKAVVIATGSTPTVPPALEAVRDRVLVNDDVFELERLPASAAVVGTGIIGLELGQAMARLGVRVTFFSHSHRLGQATDPEVARVIREVFGNELDLKQGVELTSERTDSGCRLRWDDGAGNSGEDEFEVVVAAAGRRPNLIDMGLENSGVELDDRGIPHFDRLTMQCGDSPIFIAGDVNGELALLHEASDEGRIAGANAAAYPDVSEHARRTPLSITFTDPQIAIAGLSYRELDPDRIVIGEVDYGAQGRARVMGKNAGVVRIYGDAESGRLLGAEMFGPRVENTAHLLAWAMQSGLTVEQALEMPFYHPVVEEGIRTALRDVAANLERQRESAAAASVREA